MRNRKLAYIGLIFLLGLMVYGVYNMKLSKQLINEKGKYTIGVIKKIKVGSKGIRVFIDYHYNFKDVERDYLAEYSDKNNIYIGKRIFIKFIPNSNNKSILVNLNCIAPDSIQMAPDTGWSEKWMCKNFPGYIELMK